MIEHTDVGGSIDAWLAVHGPELVRIRRHLHAHPELSGHEHDTTALLDGRLREAHLDPHGLPSGTGLIVDIGSPDAGPTLAIRADLDALAMNDRKDVSYRSTVPGVAHACGHDVHTTAALGAALHLAERADRLPGRVRFLFQPAEERVPGGALDILRHGGLDGVDAIVGLHCEPKLDVGRFALRPGAITSASDAATITIDGPGGHTARPELTVDLVALAGRVVCELPARLRASLDHAEAVKLVFGAIHAGDAGNVIPTTCTMRAAVRSRDLGVWESLSDRLDDLLGGLLDDSGASWTLDYVHGVPPVSNDPDVTEFARRVAIDLVGADHVEDAEQSWGGDDFAWFTREVPGTYIRLGTHDPAAGWRRLDLHAGEFDVHEGAIAHAVRLLVVLAERYLDAGGVGGPTA